MFRDKKILITGGTGSWGNELAKQLLEKDPEQVRIFSRGEFAQVTMERNFNDERLKFIIGNVRDYSSLKDACKEIDYIFHLAALKHVPICEEQPLEAIKTNIQGTENLIKAAIANQVKKVIDVSTDKAVDPINLYGMTKAVGERLIIHANKITDDTKFICIRAGNVLGTQGSVVPYFIKLIKEFNKILITDKRMTRFFMTLPDAISLLFKATEKSIGGETFVEQMPSFKILDLAKALIDVYGNNDTKIIETGIRPGEKIDEVLVSRYEAVNSYVYDESYYLILPVLYIDGLAEHYEYCKLEKASFFEYSSNSQLSDIGKLKELLKRGGFID
ncbi:MAG: polysaccharide biosynthesis protein [Candidatus Hodarchaeota archaeon]